MELKRHLFISACFDVGSTDHPSKEPVANLFYEIDSDCLLLTFSIGFTKTEGVHNMNKLQSLKSKQDIYAFLKRELKSALPKYKGKCEITDFYISPKLGGYMHHVIGVINIENDPTPKGY